MTPPSWPPRQGITDLSDHVTRIPSGTPGLCNQAPRCPQVLHSEATRGICLKCNLTKSLLSLKISLTPTASVGLATAGSAEHGSCGVPHRSKTRQVQEMPPANTHNAHRLPEEGSSVSRTPAS